MDNTQGTQEVTPLEDGKFEVLISKAFGQDEQIQVRCTISDPSEFEPMRKKLYDDFIRPRSVEHAQETLDYQQQMSLMQEEIDANVEEFRKFIKSNKKED